MRSKGYCLCVLTSVIVQEVSGRGGGGGRGGRGFAGGYHSHTRGGCNSTNNDEDGQTGTDDCSDPNSLVPVLLGVAFYLICYLMEKPMSNIRRVLEMRREISRKSDKIRTCPLGSLDAPAAGSYSGEYIENGVRHKVRLRFTFKRAVGFGRGFEISGSGQDSDGETTIVEGFVNRAGEAYWVEQENSRRWYGCCFDWLASMRGVSQNHINRLLVLTTGQFDLLGDGAFKGEWTANSGAGGSYTLRRESVVPTSSTPAGTQPSVIYSHTNTKPSVLELGESSAPQHAPVHHESNVHVHKQTPVATEPAARLIDDAAVVSENFRPTPQNTTHPRQDASDYQLMT